MMKKKLMMICCAAVLTAATLAGCNTSKNAEEQTTEAKQETIKVDYAKGLNEDGTLADVNAADLVKVCDYKNITINKSDVTPTEETVQYQIDSLMESYQTTEQVTDREVKDGDTVNIDFVGKVDGKEFEGGSATGTDLTIGSKTFIDDFEDQLIGHKPGETVEVKVTFPDDYGKEELNGKEAVFTTTINYISVKKEQELTDEFVKENLKDTYGYTSVKDMKEKITEELTERMKSNYVQNYLVENSKFEEIPESLVNTFVDVLIDSVKYGCSMQGYTFENYLTSYGFEDEKDLRDSFYSECESQVKLYLVTDVIAAKENISVSEDDIKAYLQTDDYSVYVETYSEAYIKRAVLNDLVEQKVLDGATIK